MRSQNVPDQAANNGDLGSFTGKAGSDHAVVIADLTHVAQTARTLAREKVRRILARAAPDTPSLDREVR